MEKNMYILIGLVSIWWVSNSISTIFSKQAMNTESKTVSNHDAFTDLKWIELTLAQQLLAVCAGALWIKIVLRKQLMERSWFNYMPVISTANVIGNLATNAAFSLMGSSSVQVVKSCEPLVTYIMMALVERDIKKFSLKILSTMIMLALGAWWFISSDAKGFRILGLVVGLISGVSLPLRNVAVKRSEKVKNLHPVQQYYELALDSVKVLVPLVCVKVVWRYSKVVALQEFAISSVFHVFYNMASISVLASTSPVTHSVLNLCKRIFVTVANLQYFADEITVTKACGGFIVIVSLTLFYILKNQQSGNINEPAKNSYTTRRGYTAMIIVLVFMVMSIFMNSSHISRHGAHMLYRFSPQLRNKPVDPHPFYLYTAWSFPQATPNNFRTSLTKQCTENSTMNLIVFCGHETCFEDIRKMQRNLEKIPSCTLISRPLNIRKLLANTPLQLWLKKNPLYKILSGENYLYNVEVAVRLSILRKLGPYLDLVADHNNGKTVLVNDSRVIRAMNRLTETYELSRKIELENLAVKINFKICHHHLLMEKFDPADKSRKSHCSMFNIDKNTTYYGTFWRRPRGGANLGDENQAFPGVQFLPYTNKFIEREDIVGSVGKDPTVGFLNAWYGYPMTWPPPSNLQAYLFSMHFELDAIGIVRRNESVQYLKKHAPIGSRDMDTMRWLTGLGVPTYFSGCMTLMTQSPTMGRQKNGAIIAADVPSSLLKHLPNHIRKVLKSIKQQSTLRPKGRVGKFCEAFRFVETLSEAKVVITQRIHSALPCVAMGVPVVFINSPGMPGGGGSKKKESSRVMGLTDLFHTLDKYKIPDADGIRKWLADFDWTNPPPNPNPAKLMRFRATLWNVIRTNEVIKKWAFVSGIMPLQRPQIPASDRDKNSLLFHVIYDAQPDGDELFFTWRHKRCIESIFYHHPFAKVIIHSNTLAQSNFDVFTESAYDIEVHPFNSQELLLESPGGHLKDMRNSMKVFLLKYLLLYKFGGVYMNINSVLTQKLDGMETNILPLNSSDVFMKFEKENEFLKKFLVGLSEKYEWKDASELAKIAGEIFGKQNDNKRFNMTTPPQKFIYRISTGEEAKNCFWDASSENVESKRKQLRDKTYIFYSNELTGGHNWQTMTKDSLCHYFFNNFCVLCNELH